MKNEINILLVRPGQYPEAIKVEHTLENLQKLVGGDIELVYPWRDNACIVCDDEGKLKGSPLNRPLENYDVLAGTFLVCGLGDSDICSLTPNQMKFYEKKYHTPYLFFTTLTNHIQCMECTPAQYEHFQRNAHEKEALSERINAAQQQADISNSNNQPNHEAPCAEQVL